MHTSRGLLLTIVAAGWLANVLPAAPVAEKGRATPSIQVHKGKYIDFRCGDHLVARYVIDPSVAKPYFWPVNTPSGTPITRGWPLVKDEPGAQTDHVHQKSAWFCHGDVIPEGLKLTDKIRGITGVDFWSENKGHGRIVCTRVGKVQQGDGYARLVTYNEWQTAGGTKIMDETRTLTLRNYGTAQLLEFDIDLYASAYPITFGDTKEGSLGVRVCKSLTERFGKGTLTNADGRVGEQGPQGVWGEVSDWCDYSGKVGDESAGIAIFADPKNPSPTAWHARGYGLLAANPFGRASFPGTRARKDELVKIPKGEHLKFRYGIYIHEGDVKQGQVAEHYKQFVAAK